MYHVERVIKETGVDFGDGSHIIYVNGSYKNDEDPIGKLMHDFRCTSSVDMFYPLLAKQVKYFKETEGGRKIVCKAFEDLAEKRLLEEKKMLAKSNRDSLPKGALFMNKICAILMTMLLLCGLCGCGDEAVEVPDNYDYGTLTEPVVDLLITDCITEQDVSTVLGYPMHFLGLGDSNTQATYQSEDGACIVSISLKNQTRELFDTTIADLGDSVTLYEGLGEAAYLSSVTGELLVYQSGYFLGVGVSCQDTVAVETYTRQIAELMVAALQPTA